jgi:hypothetical protein
LDAGLAYSSGAETYGSFERASFRLTTPWDQFPTDPYFRYYLDAVGFLASVTATRIEDVLVENAGLQALIRAQLGR